MYDPFNFREVAETAAACARRDPMLAAWVERLIREGRTSGPEWDRAVDALRRNRRMWKDASEVLTHHSAEA